MPNDAEAVCDTTTSSEPARMAMQILFLEDDPVISDIVIDFLEESYEVTHCFDPQEALRLAESKQFSLYLFDINVPGMTGIELLRRLRAFDDATPTILLTAYQETRYLTQGFDAGAHDFIRKPFELDELYARIENIKRLFKIDETIAISSTLTFDPATRMVIEDGKKHHLSPKESQLLSHLISNRHRIVSTNEILQTLWDYDEMPSDNTIRTYIKKLRQIIGKTHIINVHSVGYRFE